MVLNNDDVMGGVVLWFLWKINNTYEYEMNYKGNLLRSLSLIG